MLQQFLTPETRQPLSPPTAPSSTVHSPKPPSHLSHKHKHQPLATVASQNSLHQPCALPHTKNSISVPANYTNSYLALAHICIQAVERRWNVRARETGAPRKNPPASGIVQHDSHTRKFGSEPAGEPRSPWWEASALATAPPLPLLFEMEFR
ncbi:hypothetical protein PR048_015827 [Dryococelus australis]|uniref:Uncharacterized protein n=1 Tax=Dryococelus australis TaxID=614101 RepID=A0ABQ9HIK0_9NEOP|nr:hypothetical protein PR048_015827 [Dryococelus australis]